MKRLITLLIFLFSLTAQGQILRPSKWTFSIEESKNGETTLIFKVKLDQDWHLYSQFTPDGGPLPTVFKFDKASCFERIGKVTEPKPHEEFDAIFGVKVFSFETEVVFRQKVKVKGDGCIVKGVIEYQVCKESCIYQDTVFSFSFGKSESSLTPAVAKPETSIAITETPAMTIQEPSTDAISEATLEDCGTGPIKKPSSNQTLIAIFLAGMIGGFLALLTPCVFPMIPMTVSFFTKRSGSRSKGIKNALLYAASIIFIYVVLGLLVTVSFGSDALNELSSNAYFNLAFFIIFVIFALSFFGAFEITLPSWIINKADSASDKGGMIGIFFMAFTLSLVSFSCTGPIIGTLLVEAARGRSYLGPLAGMTGFSLALAIPFALFALFPEWLNSLPKSGGWLNTVKVTLGFIELALALKFLSNVDLAYHWGFLKRELFISLWVVNFTLMGFYLLGKLQFTHDSEVPYITVSRLMFALITFTFALYLIPGLFGAPLKMISGFPPPDFYKEWQMGKESDCPHDLSCFHDYDEGMKYARMQGKPVIVDFTGWSCVNCRKMEDNVWSDPKVLKKLSENYVLISLYVDDKTELPEKSQYVSATTGKKIRTTGNKWSEMQANIYHTNSQPYYVLLDHSAKILAEPIGYTPEIQAYSNFLEEGLCRFNYRKINIKSN